MKVRNFTLQTITAIQVLQTPAHRISKTIAPGPTFSFI